MKRTTSLNLTSGPILKTLSELALPIMASSMLATAYNITDMAWIGMLAQRLWPVSVSAACMSGSHRGLPRCPVWAARYTLHRPADAGTMKRHAAMPLPLYSSRFSSGLLFSAACVLFIDPLLGFFQLDDANTYAAARSYMLITCGLLVFSYLNLTLTGLSTAQGDSKTPLMANLLGLISNMILDPMLILGIGPFPPS